VERLLALGCEYGQGYYFSQPMDAKAAEQFMLEQIAQTRVREAGKLLTTEKVKSKSKFKSSGQSLP
jgi:EAL domain-containing protein (putative c-di-GMP-specific phosphodiesterase class I)